MKNKILKAFLAIIVISFIASCSKKDDKWSDFQKFGPNKDLVGEYWVTYYDSDMKALDDPSPLMIYNTSSSEDSIWIDDNKHFWSYKVKAKAGETTFSVNKGIDLYYDDSTTITKGSVSDGNIYMELEWSTDPGTIYICKGKRRTGFE